MAHEKITNIRNANQTTMKHHLTQVRMATIKKFTNNKCWRGCGEKGTLLNYWWECKLIQSLWRKLWRLLKKLKIELLYDPAIPLLGIHQEKRKTLIQKDVCTPIFILIFINIHNCTIYNSQDMETIQVSINK